MFITGEVESEMTMGCPDKLIAPWLISAFNWVYWAVEREIEPVSLTLK